LKPDRSLAFRSNSFSAWAFVAALTVCSAYFGRLGVVEDYERAIQQVDEILQHFARNSPQARRNSLILKKLSKVALDYVKRLEHKGQAIQDILMPELFRLNPAQSAYSNDGSQVPINTSPSIIHHTKMAPTSYVKYSYASQSGGSQGESLATNNETFRHRKSSGTSNQVNVSTMGDSESLLDLAYTFHDLSSASLDMFSDPAGGIPRIVQADERSVSKRGSQAKASQSPGTYSARLLYPSLGTVEIRVSQRRQPYLQKSKYSVDRVITYLCNPYAIVRPRHSVSFLEKILKPVCVVSIIIPVDWLKLKVDCVQLP
jgi:hypothetical protein